MSASVTTEERSEPLGFFAEHYNRTKKLNPKSFDEKCFTREFLEKELPNGRFRNEEFCLGSPAGEDGDSFRLNINNGKYCQFNPDEEGGSGKGAVSYFSKVFRTKAAETVAILAEKLNLKKFTTDEGVIVPVPAEHHELDLKPHQRKDLRHIYKYFDTDGGLLGYRLRYERSGGKKTVVTYTYRAREGWKGEGWGGINPIYGLEEITKARQGDPIVFVEGEKCVDYAKTLDGEFKRYIWASWASGGKAIDTVPIDLLKGRTIYLWADNDGAGRKTMLRLAMRLQTLENVKVFYIDPSKNQAGLNLPEGWDIADNEYTKLDLMKEIENAVRLENLSVVLSNWVYYPDEKSFIEVATARQLDKEGFNDLFASQFGNAQLAKMCLESPDLTKISGITYKPSGDKLVMRGGVLKYNRWNDLSVEAIEPQTGTIEENVKPFLIHMGKLVPDEMERTHILNWLSWQIQHQGEKINHALLIQGKEGIGKSFIAEMLRGILGQNVRVFDNEDVDSKYTDFLQDTQLLCLQELLSSDKRDMTNKMKSWITDHEVKIHQRYHASMELENVVNFLLFTNYKDAIYLDIGDRRYFVYFSPLEPQPTEYYQELFDWMYKNLGLLKTYFLQRDLENFNPKAPPPMTKSKEEMIKSTKGPTQFSIESMVEDEERPFNRDVFTLRELEEILKEKRIFKNPKQVSSTLKDLAFPELGRVRMPDGSNPRVFCCRNYEKWKDVPTEEIAKQFRGVI